MCGQAEGRLQRLAAAEAVARALGAAAGHDPALAGPHVPALCAAITAVLGRSVLAQRPPIRDSGCCCHPLTGVPCLRPGPRRAQTPSAQRNLVIKALFECASGHYAAVHGYGEQRTLDELQAAGLLPRPPQHCPPQPEVI